MPTDGLTLEVPGREGGVRGALVRLVDWNDPDQNDWAVSHQVEICSTPRQERASAAFPMSWCSSTVILAVFELKNPANAGTGFLDAYHQLQTYLHDIPSLFVPNVLLVASDDVHARLGSITPTPSASQVGAPSRARATSPRAPSPSTF